MGINHSLEKILSAGWMVEFYPKDENGYSILAWKNGFNNFYASDEYSPSNAIKLLEEKIFDEV